MSIEDRAQEHEILIWERNNRTRPPAPTFGPGDPGYGPAECQECEDPMPDLRRQMGKLLCTGCQGRHEAQARR